MADEWDDLLSQAADAKAKLDAAGHALSDADGGRAAGFLEAVVGDVETILQVLESKDQGGHDNARYDFAAEIEADKTEGEPRNG